MVERLTVVLFTSPVPSHPQDWVLENVYSSIRHQLPDCRILVLCDGVNGAEPETYQQFKRKIKDRGYETVEYIGWNSQTLMLKKALENIHTPLILVGEHDWGIRDLPINWEGIAKAILDPEVAFSLVQIRQAHLAEWEKDHFGQRINAHGIILLETNWFQCPMHVASCEWYKKIVVDFATPQMLEGDQMNAALEVQNFKGMACYIPSGEDSGRLYHLDGRNVKDFFIAGGMFQRDK